MAPSGALVAFSQRAADHFECWTPVSKGVILILVAQEPKSQSSDASPRSKEGKPSSQKRDARPPRDGKNKRGGKGGRRSGGRGDRKDSNTPLTTGLFSGLADKQLPCKIKGCNETFLWTAQQQLRSFGKPAPQRMCETHAAQLYDLADKTLPCRNAPICENTWVWKRGAQLHARQRQEGEGELRTPVRLCESCYSKEKELKDQEVECRTQGCNRSWMWTKDAQIRHRAWLRRELAKAAKQDAAQTPSEAADPSTPCDSQAQATPAEGALDQVPSPSASPAEGASEQTAAPEAEARPEPREEGKKRKRRKKPKRLQEGPPERHCKACAERFAKLVPVELPCKVHGCKNLWTWDRVGQLKAWAALGTDDVNAPVKLVKRMCTRCRDFCKKTKERDVACANEKCDKTWRFKVGAQLQHVLGTGGVEDPRRMCDGCIQEQYKINKKAGAEAMPCAQPGCDGTWLYVRGMPLAPDDGTEIPADRLCNGCRVKRGLEPRAEASASAPASSEAASAAAEPSAAMPLEAPDAPKADSMPAQHPAESPSQDPAHAVSDQDPEQAASDQDPGQVASAQDSDPA